MVIIDLINNEAIEINSTYQASFKLTGFADLTQFVGECQIKVSNAESAVVLSPDVNIINKDIFSINVAFDDYPIDISPGNYQYDVLFSNSSERFYAVGGKVQIVRRITQI